MKKILVSALLVGILLGTTSPVFAAEGKTTQSTVVSTDIAATYTVTIPATLALDLMSATPVTKVTGNVILENLTAAGSISVGAVVNNLTLTGGTGLANETLTTTIAAGAETPAASSAFSLTNGLPTKNITVGTTELTKENLPGAYTGSILFTFDYVPDIGA